MVRGDSTMVNLLSHQIILSIDCEKCININISSASLRQASYVIPQHDNRSMGNIDNNWNNILFYNQTHPIVHK